jgi:hypothetical protein
LPQSGNAEDVPEVILIVACLKTVERLALYALNGTASQELKAGDGSKKDQRRK